MLRSTQNLKTLRTSTALMLALALVAPHPMSAMAQQADAPELDCTADPADPACGVVPETSNLPVEETAPPAEETPTAEPVVEDLQVEETPVEAIAEEVEPVTEADAPVVEEAPAPEPAQEAATEESATEEPVTEETVAEDIEPEEVQPVEPVLDEAMSEEAPAEEEPTVQTTEAPQEQPETTATDEAPIEQAPLEEPAQAAEQTDAAADTAETTETEPLPESETQDADRASAEAQPESESTANAAEPAPEVTLETVLEDTETAPSVIPDTLSQEQSTQIQEQEQRRRDDARERRDELLGAAAIGAAIGVLIPALGGTVVEDQGDRLIVERDGEYFVRRDESSLLRAGDADLRVERLRGGNTRETLTRNNGVQVVTVRDPGGYILFRSRILPDGREIVLVDNREYDEGLPINFDDLPALQPGMPLDLYVLPARQANYDDIYQTFAAPPVQQMDQRFSLRQIRENERLRAMVRRVDLDTITFETGQATVRQSQVPLLEDIARASIALIEEEPETLLLVEGHTDAVGSDISNLALSDRRAETVARILSYVYGVPPENLIVQGYGEQFLKIPTEGAEERNRRVTIRNITPLLGRN